MTKTESNHGLLWLATIAFGLVRTTLLSMFIIYIWFGKIINPFELGVLAIPVYSFHAWLGSKEIEKLGWGLLTLSLFFYCLMGIGLMTNPVIK